jgi:starch phosphorylase
MPDPAERSIAYFSMEIAVTPEIPTYSGGLGVLAGDTIRSAADLQVPMVAVTLLHRKGYFSQHLDADGRQQEQPAAWDVERVMTRVPQRTEVMLEGRTVHVGAWIYEVQGFGGFTVPVVFLDADVPQNAEADRTLTHTLYGGDARYRLAQEVMLGIGGVKMLRALGYTAIERFHMNEGHASLLTLALLDEEAARGGRTQFTEEDVERVRQRCVFTTHTPVPAGHDQFALELVGQVLGRPEIAAQPDVFCCQGVLNMTHLAMNLSGYVNGVAKRHGEVSQMMFTSREIDAITNGVHVATWAAHPFRELFDRYLPDWRMDNFSLRRAGVIPLQEIWQAHQAAKQQLVDYVGHRAGVQLDPNVLTLGFARRAATYKRGDLLFRDLERLKRIASTGGRFQVVYAGKAHPKDQGGKELIQRIVQAARALAGSVTVVYLENYDMVLGQLMTAGVDVWLNTPQPPLEASGTSGMKAALNGVPSLSVLDGWWLEGHLEGVTGWAIGDDMHQPLEAEAQAQRDAASLYDKLEHVVIPLFYHHREQFIDIMRHAIAINGSFFNTQRMLQEYVFDAYFRP